MTTLVHGTTFINPPGVRMIHCMRVPQEEGSGLTCASTALLGGRFVTCPACRAITPGQVRNDYFNDEEAKGILLGDDQ